MTFNAADIVRGYKSVVGTAQNGTKMLVFNEFIIGFTLEEGSNKLKVITAVPLEAGDTNNISEIDFEDAESALAYYNAIVAQWKN